MIACKRPDPIRLQPTIEEPPELASMVQMSNVAAASQLMRGFYDLQGGTWRWTAPNFSVALAAPAGASTNGAWVVLNFTLPDASLEALKKITVSSKIDNVDLPAETFTTPGDHTYRHQAPAAVFAKDLIGVNFTVDKFLTPAGDGRDLALVVSAVGLEAK